MLPKLDPQPGQMPPGTPTPPPVQFERDPDLPLLANSQVRELTWANDPDPLRLLVSGPNLEPALSKLAKETSQNELSLMESQLSNLHEVNGILLPPMWSDPEAFKVEFENYLAPNIPTPTSAPWTLQEKQLETLLALLSMNRARLS